MSSILGHIGYSATEHIGVYTQHALLSMLLVNIFVRYMYNMHGVEVGVVYIGKEHEAQEFSGLL